MRDILKKLRCGGGSSAAKTSESCEEPKDGTIECEHDEGQENAVGREQETEKLLVENGETSKECKKEDEGQEEKKDNDSSDKSNESKEEKDEDVKEDESQKEKDLKSGTEDNGESIENVETTEEAGEGENLIKKEEEQVKEKDGKKTKKKESGGWMCGLGKKSSKEKSEKKKKEDKKGKKGKSAKVEEVEEEGLPENEKKLIDGEDDPNEDVNKDEEKEEAGVKEIENNENHGQSIENGEKNEEVVVFVTESEAVVEETHRTEAATESNDECSVKGEGLAKGICGQEASFEIHVVAGDVLSFTCKIQDSNGNEVAVGIDQVEGSIHKATYHPSTAGIHTIEATWKGQPLNGSPFQATIVANEDS